MNLDHWADQVVRIRDLLQSSGANTGPNRAQTVELTRILQFNVGDKEKWRWTAKCEHMSHTADTAHEAVLGLLKVARERLKQAIERMHQLQTLETHAEALLADDDGDLT